MPITAVLWVFGVPILCLASAGILLCVRFGQVRKDMSDQNIRIAQLAIRLRDVEYAMAKKFGAIADYVEGEENGA
jgi:hypothetical protein